MTIAPALPAKPVVPERQDEQTNDAVPQHGWFSMEAAALEPLSSEATLKTLQNMAGRRFIGMYEVVATRLIIAVDRVPLSVSLLGHLARRGNSVSHILSCWNSKQSAFIWSYTDYHI